MVHLMDLRRNTTAWFTCVSHLLLLDTLLSPWDELRVVPLPRRSSTTREITKKRAEQLKPSHDRPEVQWYVRSHALRQYTITMDWGESAQLLSALQEEPNYYPVFRGLACILRRSKKKSPANHDLIQLKRYWAPEFDESIERQCVKWDRAVYIGHSYINFL